LSAAELSRSSRAASPRGWTSRKPAPRRTGRERRSTHPPRNQERSCNASVDVIAVGVDEVRKLAGPCSARPSARRRHSRHLLDFTRPQSPKQPQPASSSSEATIYSADSTTPAPWNCSTAATTSRPRTSADLRNADDPGPLTIRLVDPLSKPRMRRQARPRPGPPSRARANPQLALKHGTLARERPQRLEPLSVRG